MMIADGATVDRSPATVGRSDVINGAPRTIRQLIADPTIAELDGVRALACLVVMLNHFDGMPGAVSWKPTWDALVAMVSGSMGLICFFTLSGFLLTFLAVLEHHRSGQLDVRAFYMRRIFRIWPLHFTVIGVVMFLIAPFGPFPIGVAAFRWCIENLWTYGLFVNNWSPAFEGVGGHVDSSPSMLNISWSIAVEEQIYLVFPAIMLAILRGGRRWRMAVVAGVIGAAFAYRLLAHMWWGPFQTGRLGVIYFATFSYLDVVLAGGIAGWICAHRRLRGEPGRPSTSARRRGLMVAIAFVTVSLFWREVGGTYLDVVAYPLMAIVFGVGMLWITENPGSAPARVLRWKPLRVLGTLSFGLYLWHFTGQAMTHALFGSFRPLDPAQVELLGAATLTTYLAVSLLMATLSYALVERPFLQLRVRLTKPGRSSDYTRSSGRHVPSASSFRLATACLAVAAASVGLAHLLVTS